MESEESEAYIARVLAVRDDEQRIAVLRRLLEAVVQALGAIEDPAERLRATHELMASWRGSMTDTSDLRHFAARELWDAGWRYPDFMTFLDADKTTVQAILRGRAGLKRDAKKRAR